MEHSQTQTPEMVAKDLGASIQFLKSGTLARGFRDEDAFEHFRKWLELRNYSILSIKSSSCLVYAAPCANTNKGV